jgi:ATP/maltotriose-dependent transcriptional regulator MalT
MGHNEDLNTLWSTLQPSASARRKVAILHGLGGIGKTQLAIHFARIHQNDFSAIFWLNGKSRETLIQSLAEFLPKLPGVDVTKKE